MSSRDYTLIDVRLEVEAQEARAGAVAQELMLEAVKEIRALRAEVERLTRAMNWA